MLINSLLDLFKIQGTLIYIVTNDNEILMPNIKIIDLILLNPKKYKNLKILTTYEEYTYLQNNRNFKEKKFDRNEEELSPSLNNLNDFYGSYDDTRIKKLDSHGKNQNLYENNLNQNILNKDSSMPYIPVDKTDREKEPINTTGFSSVLKQDRDSNSNDYSKFSNYTQNRNSLPRDDLLIQKNIDEYGYGNTTKKSSIENENYKNDNYSNFKSTPSNLDGDYSKFSSKNYENTINNISSSASATKFNPNNNNNKFSTNTDYEDKLKNKNQPTTSYERLLIKDRDKSGYLDDKELSGTLPKNNFSSNDDFNYEKNTQLKTFGSEFKPELRTELRAELKTPPEDNKLSNLNNLNSVNSFGNFRDKDELSNKGDGGLGMTGKYNYSERIKDDMNRQRFASEKRSYRNPSYGNKRINF
jgi:hypothetical protein